MAADPASQYLRESSMRCLLSRVCVHLSITMVCFLGGVDVGPLFPRIRQQDLEWQKWVHKGGSTTGVCRNKHQDLDWMQDTSV